MTAHSTTVIKSTSLSERQSLTEVKVTCVAVTREWGGEGTRQAFHLIPNRRNEPRKIETSVSIWAIKGLKIKVPNARRDTNVDPDNCFFRSHDVGIFIYLLTVV